MMLFDWLDSEFVDAVSMALLHSLWQGVLVVSVLTISEHIGLINSPRRKYLAYMNGLLLMGLATIGSFIMEFNFQAHVTSPEFVTRDHIGLLAFNSSVETATSTLFWQEAVLLLWLVGFLIIGTINSIGLVKLQGLVGRSCPAPAVWQDTLAKLSANAHIRNGVRLVSTRESAVPFVFGVIRPIIVFPAIYFNQLTAREIEAILVHELTHIGRNDFLLNIIQIVVESLLFFNPATWWLSREIRRQREYCCDDKVWETHSKRTYMEALYKVAQLSTYHNRQSVALFQNNSELIMRVKRMSSRNKPAQNLRSFGFATIGLLTVLCLFAFRNIDDSGDTIASEFSIDDSIESIIELEFLNSVETVAEIGASVGEMVANRIEQVAFAKFDNDRIETVVDTHPPTAKMLELERMMEAKADEMEELAEQMEEAMEESLEAEIEKLEAIAEEMEEVAERYEEQMEEEFENSPEMERLEELSEMMEEHMEGLEEELEEVNEELIEEIEEKMEAKAEEYEEYNTLTDEQRAALALEMDALSKEMNAAMKDVHQAQRETMNDPAFKEMQAEMSRLSQEISSKHVDMEPMHAELREMQAQMEVQQLLVQETMQREFATIQEEMLIKQQEMEELQRELEKAVEEWRAKHDEH